MSKMVNEWLKFARRDLLTADNLIRASRFLPEPIAFHAQQAVEKSIKGYLAAHSKRFSKTHDIKVLIDQVSEINSVLSMELKKGAILTEYAVSFRYPEVSKGKITKVKAKKAYQIAFEINKIIKSALLKKVL